MPLVSYYKQREQGCSNVNLCSQIKFTGMRNCREMIGRLQKRYQFHPSYNFVVKNKSEGFERPLEIPEYPCTIGRQKEVMFGFRSKWASLCLQGETRKCYIGHSSLKRIYAFVQIQERLPIIIMFAHILQNGGNITYD